MTNNNGRHNVVYSNRRIRPTTTVSHSGVFSPRGGGRGVERQRWVGGQMPPAFSLLALLGHWS